MKFEIKKNIPIPADLGTGGGANPHTFPWADMAPGDMISIPKSYWVERGSYTDESYNRSKARNHVRNHFSNWQDRDAENRKGLMLKIENDKDGSTLNVWIDKAPATQEADEGGSEAPAKGKGGAKKVTRPK